ncbi:MAG: DUF87 domain-containing protein [Candidatus Micrarchaeota archaeon]|nr:DUF87 domain-containing protein [Candidatus Micrarchaeota archaeon]
MTGRGCVIGQSGSGKSFLVGVIAEELCRLNMPFCVIDTEGEYRSLKSLTNVIVVGADGDVNSDVDFPRLFSASIENDIPVVIDVSEVVDSRELVFKALESLYLLENRLRKPYLVMVEEGDKFAPQVIGKRINVIEEISVRGRKRGIGLLIATQRPANISKNVLSQCSYGFIGKLTIENDLNAIKILFEDRSRLVAITRLGVGEFVTFGIGASKGFKVKGRVARHIGMTPEVGSYKPQSNKLSSLIRELKTGAKSRPQSGKSTGIVTIDAIPASFPEGDARAYAQRIAKKRFAVFGSATERVESIELQYIPAGELTFRIPTGKRNEFLEYHMMMYGKCNMVDMDKRVSFIGAGESPNKHRKRLAGTSPDIESVDVQKDSIMKGTLREKNASACLEKFFPNSFLTEFRVVHLPIYRITLKKGNTVRVFKIDGIYGKEIELPT